MEIVQKIVTVGYLESGRECQSLEIFDLLGGRMYILDIENAKMLSSSTTIFLVSFANQNSITTILLLI